MKNKGFTLVELLAVILILGIIALIAIPTVSSVVNQAREGAKKTTIGNYMNAIDEYIMMQELSGTKIADGIYSFADFKDKVDIKGDIEGLEGTIIISSSEVSYYSISDGEKTYTEKNDEVVVLDTSKRENSTLTYPYYDSENKIYSIVDFETKDSILNIYFVYDYIPSSYSNVVELSSDNKIKGYLVSKGNDQYDLVVSSDNNIQTPASVKYLFANYTNVQRIVLNNFDTINSTNLSYLFHSDNALTQLNVEKINTSNATNISYMFYGCWNLEVIDVSKFDTKKVTNANHIFQACRKVQTLDLSNWNTDNFEYFEWLFAGDTSLKEIKGIENVNVSKVAKLDGLFNSTLIESLTLNWNTSNVTSMWQTFRGMPNLKSLDISSFDTSRVTKMDETFAGSSNLETIYVGNNWNTNSVTTSTNMFTGCSKLPGFSSSKIDYTMANWDTGYLTLKR